MCWPDSISLECNIMESGDIYKGRCVQQNCCILSSEVSCVAMWLSLWWLSYAFIVLKVKCFLCAPAEGVSVIWEFMLWWVFRVEDSDRLFMFPGTLHSIVSCAPIFPSTTWQNTLGAFVYYISSEVYFLGNVTFLLKQNYQIPTQECRRKVRSYYMWGHYFVGTFIWMSDC